MEENNKENKKKTWLKKIKNTRGFALFNTFITSAAVALLFAAICFVYDVYHDSEQDKQLEGSIAKLESIEKSIDTLQFIKDNLKHIQESLSTRYLGIFPEYITQINDLFRELDSTDDVVIFEDVLYYGIKSRPNEFCAFNVQLFKHAMEGGSITVAYYNHRQDPNSGRPVWDNLFHRMVIESRISPEYQTELKAARDKELQKLRNANRMSPEASKAVDSTLCEKYFSATKLKNVTKFWNDVEGYLNQELVMRGYVSAAEEETYKMCVEIDSVKQHYLGHGKNIRFCDFEAMYRQMSEVIAKYYTKNGIELVPLDEYLTMSCWMVRRGPGEGVSIVLAFPSKYSTDEIGFYSEDEAFSRYIGTMLEGVKGQVNKYDAQ